MSMHGNAYDDLNGGHVDVTKDRLVHAALAVAADDYDEPFNPSPNAASTSEYLLERLALAARAHTAAVNKLPADRQPVKWSEDA
jgi:hypothetical protein